eukprot:6096126-Pleurochrysis_carterae.AAC.1
MAMAALRAATLSIMGRKAQSLRRCECSGRGKIPGGVATGCVALSCAVPDTSFERSAWASWAFSASSSARSRRPNSSSTRSSSWTKAPSEGVGETFGELPVGVACRACALGHVASVADSPALEATAVAG